ncbi:hypothetical protein GEMRC1_010543 [Eukaryota sp. GEM-RC1]
MGNDGGAVSKRSEIVKQHPQSVSKRTVGLECALSKTALSHTDPIMCCSLGYLFNKTVAIEALVDKSIRIHFPHIRSIKHLYNVTFYRNPHYLSVDTSDEFPFSCPVLDMPFNGVNKFKLLIPCTHVVSHKSLVELGSSQCGYCQHDVDRTITLLPSDDERLLLIEQLKGSREQRSRRKGSDLKSKISS